MNKRSILYSVLTVVLFALYLPLDAPRGVIYSFKTVIDDYIPLFTPFTIIYISYFLFLPLTWIYFLRKKQVAVLNIVLAAIIIACLSSYLLFIFFQNSIERPLIEENNVFDGLYLLINKNVPPYNAFPSLHVAISLICLGGYFAIKSKYFNLIAIWVGLIILSTVLTKQHYFLDVIGGIILAISSYKIAGYYHRGE